jgi:hypothetical protein
VSPFRRICTSRPCPPYTPELQLAERLWTYSNTPLLNVRPADLEELDTLQLDRCAALQSDPALVATIQPALTITGSLPNIL